MKVNQNFIILDIETGHFDPNTALLTQIGFIIVDGFTFQEKYRFNSYIYPYSEKHYISKEASKLTGITKEKLLKEGRPLKEVLDEICEIWKKFKVSYYLPVLVGHNISFDQMFLEWVFDFVYGKNTGKNGNCKLYDYILKSSIDTMILGRQKFINDELPNFKLETIGNHIGAINVSEHNAFADVKQTLEVFKYFISCLRGDGNYQSSEQEPFNYQF